MRIRPTQNHYELLDVAPDAKREAIAVAYQRALEVLAREHAVDPTARAALKKAFEVLSDPIQRMSYDLTVRAHESDPRSLAPEKEETDSLGSRVWANPWGKALIAGAVVLLVIMWTRPAKPPIVDTTPGPGLQTIGAGNASTTNESLSGAANSSRTEAKPAQSAAPAGPRSAEDIFNQVSQSVVRINVSNAAGVVVSTGSGVVIGPGSVITNCHVALRGESLEVRLAGFVYGASVDVANEERDLCLLDVSGLAAPAVSLGSIDSVRVGQRVYAVGAPQGLDLTISDGIVSSLREMLGGKVIQTTAPVSPGSSGGGLFDTSGRMIGVVTFQTKAGQNLNFALPADWVGEMRTR